MQKCPICAAPVQQIPGPGRRQKYCSDECRSTVWRIKSYQRKPAQIPDHGTDARYRKGCRCDDCTGAARARWRSKYGGTCALCEKPIQRGSTSLPQGEATCRECRRGTQAIKQHVYQLGVQMRKLMRKARKPKPRRWAPKSNPSERGYGYAHRQERVKWKAVVDEHGAFCTRCHQYMPPGSTFDLDHSDDRTTYLGVAHPACNRGAGGTKARANEHARLHQKHSRDW